MDEYQYGDYQQNYTESPELKKLQAAFITKVYGWMFLALVITGLVALAVASSEDLIRAIFSSRTNVYILLGLQIGLVIVISWFIEKISSLIASLLFLLYSVVVGIVFSCLFYVYTTGSIASTFLVTALTFGVMSAIGYFTKKDLTNIGQLLFMGLIGIVIASIANWFMQSPTLYWIITYVGLFIFIGLVAYKTQYIKKMAILQIEDPEAAKKGTIIGALSLYLSFINIFLFLLRIMGGRK
jgi:FtsH-binding integral membrane protein